MPPSFRKPPKLQRKFAAIISCLGIALALCLTAWLSISQYNQAIGETTEKAQALCDELDAVWSFVDESQDRINHASDGTYDYKGLHCAIAGQAVAQIFSRDSDYVIRYVSTTPRNEASRADDVETKAIEIFEDDTDVTHYYELTESDGEQSMRYIQKLAIEESCLECHGSPAGEIDMTGYAKEGMRLGDVAGAISITMPVTSYFEGVRNNTIVSVLIIMGLMSLGFVIILFAIRRFVIRPIDDLDAMMARVSERDFAAPAAQTPPRTSEMASLTRRFAKMTGLLSGYYENLEHEVKTRTDQLEKTNDALRTQQEELLAMNRELQEANRIIQETTRMKAQFFSTVTHELRTPLTSILAFTEIWGESIRQGKPLDEESFEEIRSNCRILLSMVNNNLALSRLEQGHAVFTPETADIAEIVHASITSIRPLAAKKRIGLSARIDPAMPLVEIDGEKMRMVMENLLGNAVKYSEAGSAVDIDVVPDTPPGATEKDAEAETFRIVVSDRGIGIDEAQLQAIFDIFNQGDAPAKARYQGSGIGLFLSRQLVAMHGGSIEASSVKGEGSTFTVRLPVHQPHAAHEQASDRAQGGDTDDGRDSTQGASS